jgi:transcriptional regulator with XRE-family HTH domain
MRIDQEMTTEAVLAELGRRMADRRLDRGLTQEQMAARAGIGRATLQRLEAGGSIQLTSVVKLLRALDLLDALDVALSAGVDAAGADAQGGDGRRRRAPRQHRARASGDGTWQWIDGTWQWAAR